MSTTSPTSPAASAVPPAALSPAAQRLALVGMVALCSLGAFESIAVATAMPAIAVELDGLRYYTLAFAVVFATSVVGTLAAGRWCDRSGPAPAMWTGATLFVGGLGVAGAATSMGALIAGRAVQGVGSGLYGVALYVLVARVFAPDRRPAVFSAFAAAWVVPAIVGPGIAGLVVEHLGWRWVFLGAAVLTVPAAALMPPGLSAANGAAADAAAADAAANSPGGGHAPTSPLRAAGRLAAAVVRARPGLPSVISVRALVSAAFTGAEVLLPLLLVHERHLSPALAGLVLTVGALGWSTASWLRGRNLLHLSHAGYVRLGGGLLAVGVIGSALLVVPGIPAGAGMAFWVLSGSGMGLVCPTLSVLTLELAEPHEQGSASSAFQVADAVAGAVASTTTGSLLWALYDVAGVPAYAVVLCGTGMLAAAVVALAARTARGGARTTASGRGLSDGHVR